MGGLVRGRPPPPGGPGAGGRVWGLAFSAEFFWGKCPWAARIWGPPGAGPALGAVGGWGPPRVFKRTPSQRQAPRGYSIQVHFPVQQPAQSQSQPGCWTGKATPLPPKGLLK